MPGIGIILMHDDDQVSRQDKPSTDQHRFPIHYDVVKGVDIEKFIGEKQKILYLPAILKTAQRLKGAGSQAIVSECGYFSFFQREVSASSKIPTFLSSIVQLPLAQTAVGGNQKVGVIVAKSEHLTEHHLTSMGVKIGSNYQVFGLLDDDSSETLSRLWSSTIRGEKLEVDFNEAADEILAKCKQIIKDNPTLGAIVVDSTGLLPFSKQLKDQVDLPIFSLDTLLEYAHSITSR